MSSRKTRKGDDKKKSAGELTRDAFRRIRKRMPPPSRVERDRRGEIGRRIAEEEVEESLGHVEVEDEEGGKE